MIDWIRNASVLGNALIVEVNLSVLVNGYVLQKGIPADCVVDIRLGFLVKLNHLGVAAAFEVEHALVVPAVLVVTD